MIKGLSAAGSDCGVELFPTFADGFRAAKISGEVLGGIFVKRLFCLVLALSAMLVPARAEVWSEREQLAGALSAYEAVSAENAAVSAVTGGEITTAGAQQAYEILNTAGLIPRRMAKRDLSGGLERLEFCELIVPMYKLLAGADAVETVAVPYDDCDETAASEAYSLGLIATTAAGSFDATGRVSRQEAITALVGMLERAGADCALGEAELAAVCGFSDFADADAWAYNALAKAASEGFVSGSGDELRPKDDITRSEFLCAAAKVWEKYMPDARRLAAPEITAPAAGAECTGNFRVSFDTVEAAVSYTVIVKDMTRECVTELDTRSAAVYVDTEYFVDGEEYKIFVTANYGDGASCISAPAAVTYRKPKALSGMSVEEKIAKRARAFGGGNQFATAEEAAANMCSVTVPVWRLAADGTKYKSTASMTVNKNLADDIVAIFTEIFDDSSQFPIKDIGCYNWRNTVGGAQSQHSFGTCIDINSNENFYVSAGGRILAGRLWQPSENPYSITPDGIVVKTFAKYGWLWGGDAWGEGYAKDYMHMTYLGG